MSTDVKNLKTKRRRIKMLKKASLFCLVTIMFMVAFMFLSKAWAADKTTITISPLTYDLTANPGDNISNEILVRNSGSEPVSIGIEAQDFLAQGEEGDITLIESDSTYSLASWIELDGRNSTLGAGQQKRVKFIIRVPVNAEPGGHYASVYAKLSPTLDNATTGSGVGQKIASLILLRVGGAVSENAQIVNFETTKSIYQKGPVDFDLRVENTGSVHIKPKGVIAITDIWGKKVADISVEQKVALPNSIRHMTANWENTPKFGKYNATLVSFYGNENKQLTGTTTFWIVPWKEFAIFGGLIIIIATMVWFGRKRIRKALKALAGK